MDRDEADAQEERSEKRLFQQGLDVFLKSQ